MGLWAEVRDDAGQRMAFPDPAGGTFDAAGDFDRIIPAADASLPGLSAVDPYADWTVPGDRLVQLASEVTALRSQARPGSEQRGVDRLAVLIGACLEHQDLTLVFIGD